jgi:hypothetical protein
MKSKNMVYFLGFVVLGVWGVILQKIFLAMQIKEEGEVIVNTTMPNKLSVPYQYPDTFKLLLNYPDPFTGQVQKLADTAIKQRKQAIKEVLIAAIPSILNEVRYLGFVANGSGKRRVAILSYKGQERILKEGDMLLNIKVLKVENNTVKLSSNGTIKLLKKE